MTTPSDDGMIERLDAGEPAASLEEAAARAPYEQLLGRVGDLEDLAPPAGWEDRAVARWSAVRRRRRLGIVIGAIAAVGLAAVVLLQPCAAPIAPRLEVAVLTAPGTTRRGDAAVGDVLRVRARIDHEHTEVRVYVGTRLAVRCPGNERCKSGTSRVELAWMLAEAGTHEIVLLVSDADIPAPGDGSIDRDLLEARSAGASIEVRSLAVSR